MLIGVGLNGVGPEGPAAFAVVTEGMPWVGLELMFTALFGPNRL